MNNIVIKKEKFEAEKNRIKEISTRKTEEYTLKKVNISAGWFDFFDYKVTGSDFNKLTSQLQDHFMDLNDWNSEFLKQFETVYNALEALDKEYIAGILTSVEAARKASEQAKVASAKANKAQEDIKKSLQIQKQSLKMLLDFKKDLEKYKHLQRIDEVWEDTREFQFILKEYEQQFLAVEEFLHEQESQILDLIKVKNYLDSLEHLNVVDQTWSDVQSLKEQEERIIEKLEYHTNVQEKHTKHLVELKYFKSQLQELEHLLKVDAIWEEQQSNIERLKDLKEKFKLALSTIKSQGEDIDELRDYVASLQELKYLDSIDILWKDYHDTKEEFNKLIETVKVNHEASVYFEAEQLQRHATHDVAIEELQKKSKIAYGIAGSALTIASLQFILSMMGII